MSWEKEEAKSRHVDFQVDVQQWQVNFHEVWSSQGSENVDADVPGCDAMWICR
jgi:hypothetical protein